MGSWEHPIAIQSPPILIARWFRNHTPMRWHGCGGKTMLIPTAAVVSGRDMLPPTQVMARVDGEMGLRLVLNLCLSVIWLWTGMAIYMLLMLMYKDKAR